MWKAILDWLIKLFGGGTTQIGSRNQSASDVKVGDNASVVAVGQGININQPQQGHVVPFQTLEKQLPDLFAEMRVDLIRDPFVREFILMGKQWTYNPDPNKHIFFYFFEDHPNLKGKLDILKNHGLVKDVKFNDLDRFTFTEEFVNYLTK